ncbi:MAG: LytTR family DNA-binding domain-containing protein, partial [Pseudomonadota bacterium]
DGRLPSGRSVMIMALPIVLGIGAGLVGPYGTYVYSPLGGRLIYWIVIMACSFTLWELIHNVANAALPNWPQNWSGVIIALPFSLLNPLALVLIHSGLNAAIGSQFPTTWSQFVVSHLLLSLLVILPTIALSRRLLDNASTAGGSDAIDFLTEKLPRGLRGYRPFAISAEGNYVRVYTPAGSDLVLSTFEDALRAVSGIPGVQTHRSWWAAAAEMKRLTRSGSSFELELKSGLNVPVGRRRRSAIQIILDQTEAEEARRADD